MGGRLGNQAEIKMAHGGKREGAGRPTGARSRATVVAKRTFSELAKDHAEDALATAVSIMKDEDQTASARIAAANLVLDRAYGKPSQAVEVSNPDGSLAPRPLDPSRLSTAALRELAGVLNGKTAATDGG